MPPSPSPSSSPSSSSSSSSPSSPPQPQTSVPRHEQSLLSRDAVHATRYSANPVDLAASSAHSNNDLPILLPSLSLYAVHALCTFDERLYEFASYFFLMEIFKTTLLPMSLYGFSTTVAGILFSTTVGSLVDSTPRLSAVQSFLFVQKAMTVLGCVTFWILLTWFDPSPQSGPYPPNNQTNHQDLQKLEAVPSIGIYQGYSLFAFLVLASGFLKLSALGWSISIERDWVVALCHSNTEKLTHLNVNMKRIDLACKLVSPLVFAGILTQLSTGACSLVMAAWCMVSFMSELLLVRRIWFQSPVLWAPRSIHQGKDRQHRESGSEEDMADGESDETLARKRTRSILSSRSNSSAAHEEQHQEEVRGLLQPSTGIQTRVARQRRVDFLHRIYHSFREYSLHVIFLASMSYAIIYINMMSVSGTMIGYLQWRGFSAGSIALLKGICTVAELLGTIAMPVLTRYLGLVRAGAWCIWLEVLTLTPVLFSIYSDRLPVQALIFAGMALSRVGVWSFDLVITQTMQEYIDADQNNAGLLNGWHYSMMNLFELGQFFLTMVWSDPESYFIPCTLSFVCVVIGAAVYSAHVVKMRGHLFHYQRLANATSNCLHADEEED